MIKFEEKGGLFNLLEDYNEDGISIENGFTWDGASIPWYLQWLIKKTAKTKEASLVHDYIYATGSYPRALADRLLLTKLLDDNVEVLKAVVMYIVVRVFGSYFYKH